jgi:TPR repeat protein
MGREKGSEDGRCESSILFVHVFVLLQLKQRTDGVYDRRLV